MNLLPAERRLWIRDRQQLEIELSDSAIDDKYLSGEGRIVVESNREKLPGFVDQLERHDYMDLRPFYQRRPVWDRVRQSRLIESFIINVPIPPVFLYERDFNSFEVMDGQQRITAIRDFYHNRFPLEGLQYWPELNGRRYLDLPHRVRLGIDRRSISSIVMLKESAPDDEEAFLLRQIVFERLNTGGVELERQEIRNALYQGRFNESLLKLSTHDVIRDAWGLPHYDVRENENLNPSLVQKKFYSQMQDVELVLRFFALRSVEHYSRGMQPFLDMYMHRSKSFSSAEVSEMENLFIETIEMVSRIYGEYTFRSFDLKKGWSKTGQKAVFDAVMVSSSNYLDHRDLLISLKSRIIDATADMFATHPPGTFTGRANTKKDIQNRIELFDKLFRTVIGV